MTTEYLIIIIKHEVSDMTGLPYDSIGADEPMSLLGMDSLDVVGLKMRLEAGLDVLPAVGDEINQFSTIRQAAEYCRKHMEQ